MAELTVLSWRDIPAQVTVARNEQQATRDLPSRFTDAIARAARREGLNEGDAAYASQWHRGSPRPCGDDLEREAESAVDAIEAAFSNKMLDELSAAGGRKG